MSDHESSQQELQDELTAYLDGELDADDVRRVEERLARDAQYRDQLRQLERTWELLDRLPRAAVDENFTNTTLEMVALSAVQEADEVERRRPLERRRQRVMGGVTMVAALLVGLAIGSQIWPDPNRKMLEDLPVLENLDLYYQADDIEFLQLLDEKGLFDDEESDSGH